MTAPETRPNAKPVLPLSGYRALDLAGPMGVYCGKLMADMGAEVIKVEPPGGDPMRDIGPVSLMASLDPAGACTGCTSTPTSAA